MMGTNYYAETNKCQHCGRSDRLHIGKSSYGWCFGLRIYPERGIYRLEDWEPIFETNPITDEYGDIVTAEDMKRTITERSFDGEWTDKALIENHAVRGPNGLARHRAGEEHGRRTWHSPGTWDYHDFEFS